MKYLIIILLSLSTLFATAQKVITIKVGNHFDSTSISNRIDSSVKYRDTASMLSPYHSGIVALNSDTATIQPRLNNVLAVANTKLNISDTSYLSNQIIQLRAGKQDIGDYATNSNLALKVNISDTANMLLAYHNAIVALISDSVYQAAQIALRIKYTDTAYTGSNPVLTQNSIGYVSVNSKALGSILFYKPTVNTDVARGIALQNAFLAAQIGDAITIGAGDYFLTTNLSLKDSQTVTLNSPTIYHSDTTIDIFYINNANNVSISGNGLIKGSGFTAGNFASESGVRVIGNSDYFKIEGITISNFRGNGIYENTQWSDTTHYFQGGTIMNCNLLSNHYGWNAGGSGNGAGQYWRMIGGSCRFNDTAIYEYSGNIHLTGVNINYNVWGLKIVGGSGNDGHGTVTGCVFTHNQKGGIWLKDLAVGGMAFTGNIIAGAYPVTRVDTTIYINNCRGIIFDGGSMLAPFYITLDGTFTGYNYIRNQFLYYNIPAGGLPPIITGTTLQKSHLIWQQNSSMDNDSCFLNTGIPASQGGTGKTSFNPYTLLIGGINTLDSLHQVNGVGVTGQVLTSQGANTLPIWQAQTSSFADLTLTGTLTGHNIYSNGFLIGGQISNSPYTSSSWLYAPIGTGVFLVNSDVSHWAGIKSDGSFDVHANSNFTGTITTNLATGIVTSTAGAVGSIPTGTNGQVLTVVSGSPAWATPSTGMTNPMTTTGDIIYASSGSTPARLGIGSTNQVLTVSGGVPAWKSSGSLPLGSGVGVSQTGQSGPNGLATTPNDGIAHQYTFYSHIKINSIAVDVLQYKINFYDEDNVLQHLNPNAGTTLASAGYYSMFPVTFRIYPNTAFTYEIDLTTSGGSVNYGNSESLWYTGY